MAWYYQGANASGWQNDMAVQARFYYGDINYSARSIPILAETYLVTTNGRSINASFTGSSLAISWGGGITQQFAVGANSTTYYTGFQNTAYYNANGEVSVQWGGALNTNNVISFSQSVSAWFALPSIAPLALTGLSVTRVSDSQQTLSWSIPSGVTNTSVIIQRRMDDGAWATIAQPAGNVSSYADTTTVANRKYEYRVAGVRNGRQAAWTSTVTVYTTPAPPSSVSAVKVGSNIEVDASGLPAWGTAYDIDDNGSTVATDVTAFPWVHVTPNPAVTHTYKVRSKRGALVSAWSAPSNTVQLLAAPNAPSGLSPNGANQASDAAVVFSWVHNPIDTTAQAAYELRYRVGAGAWTTLSGTTASTQSVTLAVATYEWQVRTKGQHPDWSPWSASASVTVITRPGVAIVQPGNEWEQPVLPVEWTFTQAQALPQSAWEVQLLDQLSVVLETLTGSGAATAATLTTRLVDGGSYTVRARAATGGIWSQWITQAFDVAFVPPAVPVVTGGWDENTGSVTLTLSAGVLVPEPPATVSILLERSVDDGDSWEVVLSTDPGVTVSDSQSLSFGTTLYRATAVAASGAATSIVYPVTADSGVLWLSGGVGFSLTAPLPLDPRIAFDDRRDRSTEYYEGRERPVAYAGEHLKTVVGVSGSLIDREDHSAEVDQLRALIRDPEPTHLLRDPDGRRIYGVVSSVSIPRQQAISRADGWAGVWQYSFSIEETDQ